MAIDKEISDHLLPKYEKVEDLLGDIGVRSSVWPQVGLCL